MSTGNSKRSESNRFNYNFTNKSNLKNSNTNIALANLSIYYTWKNIKSDYKNNKFKIHAPSWNEAFDVNRIKNRIVFRIKTGYKLELLTEETMKLLGSLKK